MDRVRLDRLVVGGVAFVLLCWRAGRDDPRWRALMRWAWWTAVGSAVAVFLLQGPYTAGTPIFDVITCVATPPEKLDASVAAPVVPAGPFLRAPAVQVWLSPARIGENQVVVNVRDERGISRDVPEVTAQLSLPSAAVGPMPVTLAKTGPGQFVAGTVTVPMQGTWRLALRVRTSDLDVTPVDVQIRVR